MRAIEEYNRNLMDPYEACGMVAEINVTLGASRRGEGDDLKGVAENIIVGQPIKLGTGSVELAIDVKKLSKMKVKK